MDANREIMTYYQKALDVRNDTKDLISGESNTAMASGALTGAVVFGLYCFVNKKNIFAGLLMGALVGAILGKVVTATKESKKI